jgi:methionine biosynthesis protein MetW
MTQRKDLELIGELVPRGSRVLDLGCGNGELLAWLQREKGCSGYGIEIDDANVHACVQRGVNVIQLNLEEGLALFDDRSFDVVLQIDTLQHLRNTERMLKETARVGRIGIVAFPNFAHWPNRLHVMTGRLRRAGRQMRAAGQRQLRAAGRPRGAALAQPAGQRGGVQVRTALNAAACAAYAAGSRT